MSSVAQQTCTYTHTHAAPSTGTHTRTRTRTHTHTHTEVLQSIYTSVRRGVGSPAAPAQWAN